MRKDTGINGSRQQRRLAEGERHGDRRPRANFTVNRDLAAVLLNHPVRRPQPGTHPHPLPSRVQPDIKYALQS